MIFQKNQLAKNSVHFIMVVERHRQVVERQLYRWWNGNFRWWNARQVVERRSATKFNALVAELLQG